jgi:density-regulated protein DRP1
LIIFQVSNDTNESSDAEKKSGHQRRGGKGMAKPKKEKQPSKIILSKQQRKGNKYVTIIGGLASNDVDIEVAKKFFAQKFSCGCSKGENDELIIQGDVLDNLFTVIPEKFPQVKYNHLFNHQV